jgi:hypothetical protein
MMGTIQKFHISHHSPNQHYKNLNLNLILPRALQTKLSEYKKNPNKTEMQNFFIKKFEKPFSIFSSNKKLFFSQ